MVRTTTTRGPAPRRLEHIDRAGLVPKPRVRGGSFTLKPVKRIGKKPIIRGAPLAPPVGGLLRGAISIGTRLFRGSPVTGPTAAARVSSAAAGPFSGVRVNRARPVTRRSGGSARAL